jgi:hypothetical protein
MSFLEQLAVPASTRQKLQELAATSPASLLSIFYATPAALESYLGEDEFRQVRTQLEHLLGEAEVRRLRAPSAGGRMGAVLTPPQPAPASARKTMLYTTRDQLLQRIEKLEKQPRRDDNAKALDEARAQLDSVLSEIFAG